MKIVIHFDILTNGDKIAEGDTELANIRGANEEDEIC